MRFFPHVFSSVPSSPKLKFIHYSHYVMLNARKVELDDQLALLHVSQSGENNIDNKNTADERGNSKSENHIQLTHRTKVMKIHVQWVCTIPTDVKWLVLLLNYIYCPSS